MTLGQRAARKQLEVAMQIDATRGTALLSGGWTAIGLSAVESWTQQHPERAAVAKLLWAVGSLVFFFGPLLIL